MKKEEEKWNIYIYIYYECLHSFEVLLQLLLRFYISLKVESDGGPMSTLSFQKNYENVPKKSYAIYFIRYIEEFAFSFGLML